MPVISAETPRSAEADRQRCEALLRGGSKSFHAASVLLPSSVRVPATGLYAFCRVADDAIDGGDDPVAALAGLRDRLDAIYAGRPVDHPADRAFAQVVERHGIPRALPEALLEGFAWDAQGRRYATLSEVRDYAARVAGSVGVMMALVMGRRDPRVLMSASCLGVAMQLTNIARDVGEDARNGRLYLPENSLRAVGIDPDGWLAAPRFDARLASVVESLLVEADALYACAAEGIASLPPQCRPAMHAARLLYAEIGEVVREHGGDSVSARARVQFARKLSLIPLALASSLRRRSRLDAELQETRFLVDSVGWTRPATPASEDLSRAEWLLVLFERLERDARPRRELG